MSVLSFKAYYIENYAEYKNLPSSKVFKDFEKSKLLNHLESDYEDLHGMGKTYLMNYFDKWLSDSTEVSTEEALKAIHFKESYVLQKINWK